MASNRAKFVIVKDRNNGYRWKMVVRGKDVAASLTSYTDKRRCLQAIEAFKRNASGAAIPKNGE